MGDVGAELHEEHSLAPLEDDCRMLSGVLDDTLRLDVGQAGFQALNKIRTMAQAAAMLEESQDPAGARLIQDRMKQELMSMPLEEALPIVRAFGHYLNLSSIAELQHKLRQNRAEGRHGAKSSEECFNRLLAEGTSPEQLYEAVTSQRIEIVLTAHPTQVNRRTLQYKHTRVSTLLTQNDRPDLTKDEKDAVLDDLVREITGLWQTDELRRQKPTPVDEARGGLHIVEQSLWNAVPAYMRHLSNALKKATGRDLPLNATPFKFGSWMGGDRDGNPNVTAKITYHVACLARWMAADMYLREVDILRFELSMSTCSSEVWKMAKRIIRDHHLRMAAPLHHGGSVPNLMGLADSGSGVLPPASRLNPRSSTGQPPAPSSPRRGSSSTNAPIQQAPASPQLKRIQGAPLRKPVRSRDLSVVDMVGVRPNFHDAMDGMPLVPGILPGQDEVEGGSDCDYDCVSGSPPLDGMLSRLTEVPSVSDVPSPVAGAAAAKGPATHHVRLGSVDTSAPLVSDFTLAQMDRGASVGVSDPTGLRRTLRTQRAATDVASFNRTHNHPGFHPYRVILGEVRERLMNTRRRMEDLLSGLEPSPDDEWYEDVEELEKPLRAIYWSLYACGSGSIADGRLLDLIRRASTFGMCLMKLDIRQESTRHNEALDAITTYLGYGSYLSWDEEKRIAWLANELAGRRPLVPPDMPMTPEVKEVLDTCRVVAQLGQSCLGAYVISMAREASDVLAVELLQREAMFHVAAERGSTFDSARTLRVVPLFETLDDLDAGGRVMKTLMELPWYREHLRRNHGDHQEVMLGYSDSGKDAGRLAANWALYRCQEELVSVMRGAGVSLTLFHGRGGTVGRGGGPTYLAIQSQPPGSVEGSFRITEQGEMVQAKFGISAVAIDQLEIYSTAVINATLRPPPPPKHQLWRDIMNQLGAKSCEAYRSVVYEDPRFISYFRHATPEAELGNLNIGSRPSRRRADNAGITTLRAIPWQFAWTQTRLILPSWLGVGEALQTAITGGQLSELQSMYKEWPFFAATIDLIEMILAKTDARIAALYEDVLVNDPGEKALGAQLRQRLQVTIKALLQVSGHQMLLQHNPTLRKLIQMRNPFIDPINVMQVEVLRRLRLDPSNQKLRDALLVSINGIAAGMRNTG